MEPVLKLFGDLRSARTEEARHGASRRLREWFRRESRGADLSFTAAMALLNTKLSELIGSADSGDKLAGITAILELTDEPVPDNEASRRGGGGAGPQDG